ncbi:MAG: TetR/AcrR family transcriptional regulator [Trebonia sp.]
MDAGSTTLTRRPGGRSARVRDAVYAAVGQLVGQGNRETMTIPQVAERAGVNPTSVYRRWGTIEALVEEVAVAALTRDEPLPDTGDLGADLREWATIIAGDIGRPGRVAYLRALVGARPPNVPVCACWELRADQARRMVDRALRRGERAPTARQVLDHVIAPLYHHAIYGLATDAEYALTLVADVLPMRDPAPQEQEQG